MASGRQYIPLGLQQSEQTTVETTRKIYLHTRRVVEVVLYNISVQVPEPHSEADLTLSLRKPVARATISARISSPLWQRELPWANRDPIGSVHRNKRPQPRFGACPPIGSGNMNERRQLHALASRLRFMTTLL